MKEVGWWVDGWVVGTQLWFDEEGALNVERDFGESGSRDRRWIQRHYDADTGKIYWVELYVDNELQNQWLSDELHQLAMETRLDESVENAIAKFFPELRIE